jgi:hypothetical protein
MLPLQIGRQQEPGEENPLSFGLILSTQSGIWSGIGA